MGLSSVLAEVDRLRSGTSAFFPWCRAFQIEQATKGRTVYRDGLNAKPDDPPGKDIHHDQDPVTFEESGFRSKQVHTP